MFLLSGVFFPVRSFERQTFVSIVNPVSGWEGWGQEKTHTPLDLPRLQYQESTPSALPITWLLRYDAISDQAISSFFKKIISSDSSQSVGAYLEITPNLSSLATVKFPPGEFLKQPRSISLADYDQADRIKLIDSYMNQFYQRFGFFPQTVGAWYIDSFSLKYLTDNYAVTAAAVHDEQFLGSDYRLWGSYLASPYYPSQTNTLIPASSSKNRLPLPIVKWAVRDPFNFYTNYQDNGYSLQANDYLSSGLDTRYLDRLLKIYSDHSYNEFSQIIVGLDNSLSPNHYHQEIINTYQLISEKSKEYELTPISLSNFGHWFRSFYPESSPSFMYRSPDVTGNQNGELIWYQNSFYRIGLRSTPNDTQIIDLRIFNQKEAEDNYLSPNYSQQLLAENYAAIDSVKYPSSVISLGFGITEFKTLENSWVVTLADQQKQIILKPQEIELLNLQVPQVKLPDVKTVKTKHGTVWQIRPQLPYANTNKNTIVVTILIALAILSIAYQFRKNPFSSMLVFATGIVTEFLVLLTMFRSGQLYVFGMGFWGPNGHDAIFHLSLISSFRQSLTNFLNPMISGHLLQSYHLGFDYLLAIISRFSHIQPLDLYFRIIPITTTTLIIILLIKLLRLWNYSDQAITLSIIGCFLTGSLGFIPALISGRSVFSGESVFWSNQSISILLNPPFALSIVFILIFLILLERSKVQPLTSRRTLVLILLGGLLAQIKFYSFLLLALALLLQKNYKLFIGVFIVGLLLVFPLLTQASSPFIFHPFWFYKSMFAAQDHLNWQKLVTAWQAYEINGDLIKLTIINIFALTVFVLGNLGARIVGFIQFSLSKENYPTKNLTSIIVLAGIITPLILVQKSNPWNTIQFFYYAQFFLSLFAVASIASWLQHPSRLRRFVVVLIVVTLISPTTIGTLKDYLTNLSASRISYSELRALQMLQNQPRGIVISPPHSFLRSIISDPPSPKPLYAYSSTGYISAFSGQPEYLADTINLDITGYDYSLRLKQIQRFFNTLDTTWMLQFLATNNISYVYLPHHLKLSVNYRDICLDNIFDYQGINIYKFNCHEQ